MATREDYAWAAGFFDGEGTFGASVGARNRSGLARRYLRVQVAQKDRALLDRFAVIFGCGGVYLERKGGHKFQANGQEAFAIANAIWPWIGEQKRSDLKRAIRTILAAKAAVDDSLVVAPRLCAADGCGITFTPDPRHLDAKHCSRRCYQRTWKRARR